MGKDDLKTIERIGQTQFYLARVAPAALRRLQCAPSVAKAEKERVSVPLLDKSIPRVNASASHQAGATGRGFTVAVLDTGIVASHPFLRERVTELCFAESCPNGPNPAAPLTYHGTHVAGIIAGREQTVPGEPGSRLLRGVAPDARILAIQVFDKVHDPKVCGGASFCVVSYEASQLAALDHLARNLDGMKDLAAVNLSFGEAGLYEQACDATDNRRELVDFLASRDVAVVASAGNDYEGPGIGSPACIESVIAVAASDNGDEVPTALQNGTLTDFMAPGVSVTSSTSFLAGVPGYEAGWGTSVSAPHVAGAIAALRSLPNRPGLPAILTALRATGVQIEDKRGAAVVRKPRIDVSAAANRLTGAGRGPIAAAE